MTEIPLRRLVAVRRAVAPALSPDGRTLAFVSDITGHMEAFRHEGPGRAPTPLTEFRERVAGLRFTPDGRRILLATDIGGDERWAIRTVRPDGSDQRTLSRDPAVVHLLGEVSPDGREVSVATNARDPAVFDLGRMDLDTGVVRPLLAAGPSVFPGPFSPDGRFVLGVVVRGALAQDLLLVPTNGGTADALTPAGGAVRHLEAAFEPGGDSLLVLTDRDRDVLGLFRLRLEDRTLSPVFAPADREIEHFAIASGGRTALVAVNDGGYSALHILFPRTGETTPVRHPSGVVSDLSLCADGTVGACALANPGSPAEVYRVDVAAGRADRVTHSPREGVPEEGLAVPRRVQFAAADGLGLSALLWTPAARSGAGPAVIRLHGGPEAQSRPVYDPLVHALLARGLVVLEPDVRGSTGYGRAFTALDDGHLRAGAVRDVADAAEFLAARGHAEPGRISLLGASYGGWLALAALALFPDRFAAGAVVSALPDLREFLLRTGAFRREWRAAEYGDPVADADLLDSISPLRRAREIRAPILLVHGRNDTRVPFALAEEMAHAVAGAGGTAQLLALKDEGHGIVRTPNRLLAAEAILRFFERHGR